MKKLTKTIASLLLFLAAFAVVSAVLGVTAQAEPYFQKKTVVYLNGKANPTSARIEIGNLAETDSFDTDSVTSSKPGIVSIDSVTTSSTTDKTSYYGYSDFSTSSYGTTWIDVVCNKAGSSVISFKVNDITYKTTIKVVKYTNAIKTLKITGLNGGKNLASKLKQHPSAPCLLSKNIKKPVLTVAAKKNWKIKQIELTSYNGIGKQSYPVSFSTVDYNYGVSKAKLRLSPLKAKNSAVLTITMQHKKNSGTIAYYCYINYGAE